MRRLCFGLACLAVYVAQAAQPTTSSPGAAPSDAEIRRILVERIDVQKQGVGIVVGVIDPHGRRIVAYGAPEKGDKRPLDGDTVFEIGSITKVFTALLAADALYSFLSSYELRRDIGIKYVYSNLGFGLLGLGLAQRAGTDYENLVVTRICNPLGMKSTRITLSQPLRQRFVCSV